jgi:hypothetical protein
MDDLHQPACRSRLCQRTALDGVKDQRPPFCHDGSNLSPCGNLTRHNHSLLTHNHLFEVTPALQRFLSFRQELKSFGDKIGALLRAVEAQLIEVQIEEGPPMDVGSPSIPSVASNKLLPDGVAGGRHRIQINPCHPAGQRPWISGRWISSGIAAQGPQQTLPNCGAD